MLDVGGSFIPHRTRYRSSDNELWSSVPITNRTRYQNSDNETLV
jgi:hypothetical protein